MKTLEQFEEQTNDFDKFLSPLDEIDESFYHHITCGYVASNYSDDRYGQNGECNREYNGIRFYETVAHLNGKFYYLGEMPSFNPSSY